MIRDVHRYFAENICDLWIITFRLACPENRNVYRGFCGPVTLAFGNFHGTVRCFAVTLGARHARRPCSANLQTENTFFVYNRGVYSGFCGTETIPVVVYGDFRRPETRFLALSWYRERYTYVLRTFRHTRFQPRGSTDLPRKTNFRVFEQKLPAWTHTNCIHLK
jgi:hypothetical protein